MPNRRALDKAYLGGFIEREFYSEIRRAACKAGMAHDIYGFAIKISLPPLRKRLNRLRRQRNPRVFVHPD